MKKIILIIILFIGFINAKSQVIDTVFMENFNLVNSNTSINNYPFTHQIPITGSASIRNTRMSNNYTHASSGANVMFPNDGANLSIKNIDVNNITNVQISFGLMKFGNELNGNDFSVTIVVHGSVNDTVIYSPNLLTGINTSHWRLINIPILTLSGVNHLDIYFNTTALINNSYEYRIDDIIISGERDIPLFNIFKSFKINNNKELDYELENRNEQYDFLKIEKSIDGKKFTAIKTAYNPLIRDKFLLEDPYASYYRLKVSINNELFTSQIKKKDSTIENKYSIVDNKIIYYNIQNSIVIYNINGTILKEVNNSNIIDLSEFNNQLLLIKDSYQVIKIWR